MGFFDEMSMLVGRGMDAADRRSQTFRLQGDIDRVVAAKEKAFTELGRMVYAYEGADSVYGEQISAIASLEAEEDYLKQQVNAIQMQRFAYEPSGGTQWHVCPACGAQVSLDYVCCTECGDNLAELKSKYKRCPTCNVYYPANNAFCERCGGPTVTLEVMPNRNAEPVPASALTDEASATGAGDLQTQDRQANQAAPTICSVCGAPLKPDALFCGTCGNKI